jgi:cytochrome c biogenesis protein
VTTTEPRTAAGPPPASPPPLAPRELGRWAWRQLTSMRTALLLLLLLALGSVPGSVVPQEAIDASRVARWKADHPQLTPLYEKLGLFSVYDSVWFSAIYLLLMLSLVGCIVPRLAVYARAVRAKPPAAPRRLERLPAYSSVVVDEPADVVLERAEQVLRKRRYRVRLDGDAVSAERGYLREAGNLVFHMSVIAVLVCFAVGQLWGFKGGVIVPVGRGFTNLVSQYDTFDSGTLMNPEDLPPLHFDVDDFQVKFIASGSHRGQPESFKADLTYTAAPGDQPKTQEIKVNHPLVLPGVSVFLVGHGYAPVLTVLDKNGKEVTSGLTVCLPQDASFASYCVLKVPEATPQLGFDGFFMPTFAASRARGVFSAFPDALNPGLTLQAYEGNLGLDDGRPQSLYDLDTRRMKPVLGKDGKPLQIVLSPGRATTLPDGLGTIRFDGWQRWVKLQVSDAPAKTPTLVSITIGLVGLMGSLFVRRRRAWVRVVDGPEGTRVEVAGLDRSTVSQTLDDEVHTLLALVAPSAAGDTGGDPTPPTKETA